MAFSIPVLLTEVILPLLLQVEVTMGSIILQAQESALTEEVRLPSLLLILFPRLNLLGAVLMHLMQMWHHLPDILHLQRLGQAVQNQ